MGPKKSVFDYDNYREYLKDFYAHSKSVNKKFSLGYFSRLAGFKSRSVLRQVMGGERNIALHSIEKFAKALGLNKGESQFFRNLVLLNQSSSPEERQKYAEEIIKSKSYQKNNPLKSSQFNYFSHWYFVAIRELALLPGFKNDPEWIASRIHPHLRPIEVKHALEELIKLGFLQSENGQLVPSAGWLSTADEVTSAAVVRYHHAMLQRAGESIDRFPREKRDISAQTFAVSEQTAKTIKEMIQVFRKEIERVVSQDPVRDSVYQLNFQLFPIAPREE